MLKSLKIENFRCFQSFELQQLGQINLLVGKNNSGKTSILEAIQLLKSRSNLEPLRKIMLNRGEYILNERRNNRRELDIRHLFYGHKIHKNSYFSISANSQDQQEAIHFLVESSPQLNLFEEFQDLILSIDWLGSQHRFEIPLTSTSLPLKHFREIDPNLQQLNTIIQWLTSSTLTTEKMVEFFNDIVLTPEETIITAALQIVEPNIDRIASLVSANPDQSGLTTRFVAKLKDSDERIPIGSMGDGMWRILGLTLAMVNARNGVLLVDEIDTGLHYSTMSDMWRLMSETAKRLNVQVFATTHNNDCWRSLATIADHEKSTESNIIIHRIEKEKNHSVVFTEKQIIIATEHNIEVR